MARLNCSPSTEHGGQAGRPTVVLGGPVLMFTWHDLGAAAQKEFDAEELAQLREMIKHTAKMRERGILEPRDSGEGP